MVVRFRTTGPWGAGLGANLTPAQVDENFSTLKDAVDDFEAPPGVGIATVEVVGSNMTLHMTDGSTQGPFVLPSATFTDTGDWAALTNYNPMDLFLVPTVGLYLVALPYASPTEFDPDVMDTDGNLLLKLIIGIPPLPDTSALLIMDLDVDEFLIGVDSGKYTRVESSTTTTDDTPIVLTVPSAPPGEGYWQTFRQVGNRQLEFVAEDTDVTILSPESLKTRKQHSTATIVHVGGGVWDLTGDLEPA